jgi:hypothetical protein
VTRKPGFQTALTTLAALALVAGLTLDDPIRLATMILLAGLALKTYIGHLREKGLPASVEQDEEETEAENVPRD